MKMDAVPGTPTTMWFTPTKTTADMKKETKNPDFVYEISCDQMCGKGHWSMRGEIIVETQEEFDAWLAKKDPQYAKITPAKKVEPAKDSTTAPAVLKDSVIAQVIK
jgi:cytochrome c oxidase subunit 2